jgi:protein-S-isoprenylcysteine O-methyltransferase Ste14
MLPALRTVGWIACVVYSTIPLFWLMVHPRAHVWRDRDRSPFRVLVPAWIVMWLAMAALTGPWRTLSFYSTPSSAWWSWIPAAMLFAAGIVLYSRSGVHFSWAQLAGLPELSLGHHEQRLVTTGIRAHVRHPVYLGHLCEMLAWSVGTGLFVCWALTGLAIATGAVMIRMEDAELEKRFGAEYAAYRERVPAVMPRLNGII